MIKTATIQFICNDYLNKYATTVYPDDGSGNKSPLGLNTKQLLLGGAAGVALGAGLAYSLKNGNTNNYNLVISGNSLNNSLF